MAGRFTIEAVFTAIDRMTNPLGKMGSRMDRMLGSANKGIAKLDNSMRALRGGIQLTAGAFAGAGALAGVGAGMVIGAGKSFEDAITSVGAVSLMTRDQIADLEQKAMELGSSTKFSATEVANAMELMGRAGFTNAQTLQGIEGVLSAAAAEGAELAVTAGHISNVMKGLGLDMSETNRVADVLALASARTNSSISSLGESMSKVSATARQFKIPFEDAVASVALLQDVGLDASEAGSAVDTMLTMLASPTDAISAKMKAMGVTFQDAKGDMLPLSAVLQNFAKASQKSGGNMKQAAFFAELLGMRGQRAATNLKDLFLSGKVGSLVDELEKASGSAKKMAEIRMDNLTGDWEQLTGAVEGVQIRLFNLESGPLRDVVKGWTEWVEANDDLIVSGVQNFLADLRKELPGIGADLKLVGTEALGFFRGVRDNLPEIIQWTKWLGKAAIAVYAVSFAVKGTQAVMAAYGAAVAVVTYFTTAGTVGNNAYIVSLYGMRAASISTGLALGSMRTALNATAMAQSINGLTGLMRVGLLGAAAGVGYALGTWLDHTFGFSKMLTEVISKMTGLDDDLNKHGKRYNTRAEANASFLPNERGFMQGNPGGSVPTGFDMVADGEGRHPSGVSPQIVTSEERIARAITEQRSTETAEITIRDETGRAELTKKPSGGSRTKLDMPASGRPR